MVEQTTPFRPYDPDLETYDIEPYREDTASQQVAPYSFGRSGRVFSSNDSVPLFISDHDGQPDPSEYMPAPRNVRSVAASTRILAAVLAAVAVAVLFAAFSADATRDLIVGAKASIASALPAPSAAAQPDAARLTARDIQLKDPARVTPPGQTTMGTVRAVATVAVASAAAAPVAAAAAPSRVEIASAYQTALQSQPPAAAAAVPVKSIDADTMAAMMKRARSLLEAGDIPPARLLLERAADAQEASAALLLAQTYDPAVLGTPDMRSIAPDPAAARGWYEKAARLGSADAQARLGQMQN